ncbi:DUF6756 family protein [Pelagibius sp. Alg239-R121]|uniref:DUF6756 family protein n=1 Tax=Pelagibius sp. Alg239-R121 TaxID=2993448 RepID=UPI0024A6FD4E|nr:DUF6756 family protein [Pelagibius sp. Alg239-R121]
MNTDLLANLRATVETLPAVKELESAKAQALVDNIAQKYVRDRGCIWWWENLAVAARTIDYGDSGAFGTIVKLTGPNPVVSLIVSDDEPEPWPVFKGPLSDVLHVVGEQWFFEYLLVDETENWCIFDTHHNRLVIAGDL